MAHKMNILDLASWVLCTVAAIHLGIVGLFSYDVVGALFGANSIVTRVIYVVIGLLGLYSVKHMLTYKKK